MSEQIQKLEQTVTFLKARAFDVQEQLAGVQSQAEVFGQALAKIASIVGIEGESVQIEEIVSAVEALIVTPEQGELELEAE